MAINFPSIASATGPYVKNAYAMLDPIEFLRIAAVVLSANLIFERIASWYTKNDYTCREAKQLWEPTETKVWRAILPTTSMIALKHGALLASTAVLFNTEKKVSAKQLIGPIFLQFAIAMIAGIRAYQKSDNKNAIVNPRVHGHVLTEAGWKRYHRYKIMQCWLNQLGMAIIIAYRSFDRVATWIKAR